jgi:HEAT repeat protein
LRESALFALTELGAAEAPAAIAEALVDPEPKLREVAAAAAGAWSTSNFRAPSDPLPPPEARVDVRELLEALRPGPYTVPERLLSLERLATELTRASSAAARSSPERARGVIEALGLIPGSSPVPALTGDAAGADRERSRKVVAEIAAGLVPAIAGLTAHPFAPVRITAVEFLGPRQEPEARAALAAALRDREPAVRRAALGAIPRGDDALASSVATLLGQEKDWALRVTAAQVLATGGGTAAPDVVAALAHAATSDDYALVREAALRALFAVNARAARPVLERLHATDPEPRVRDAAWQLLHQQN